MEKSPARLLFLTTEVPFPADSGGKLKTFKLLERLAASYEVKVICAFGGHRAEAMKGLRAAIPIKGIQAFDNHKPRTVLQFINAFLTAPTFNAYRVYSKEMETMLQWSLDDCDVILVDHLEMMDMVPQKLKCKLIYHSHNAEFRLWNSLARVKGSFFTRWIFELEADRVRILERYAVNKSSITFAAPNDQELLAGIKGLDSSKFRLTYHLGNDQLLSLPEPDLGTNNHRIFYAGTLSWEPNRDGLQWFIQHCWKNVAAAVPSAELHICGRGADNNLLTLMRHHPGIQFHGFVDDLEEIMGSCACTMVPLRMGSGMKIKTFDALYRGLPVVSTTIGAEGIDIVHGVHAMIADDPDTFSKHLIHLLLDKEAAGKLRKSARELCRSKYLYKDVLDSMEKDISKLMLS